MSEFVFQERNRTWRLETIPDSQIENCVRERDVPYEHHLLRWIADRELRGTALDIGADIGNHALYLAIACGLQVVAFEPVMFAELERNVVLNGCEQRITVHRVALGAGPGRARDRGFNPGSSHDANAGYEEWGFYHQLAAEDGGPIEVRSLDSYGLKDVAVMKVDVEGMEPDVLIGARETIARERPLIYTEALNQGQQNRLARALGPLRYKRGRLFKRGTPMQEWLP